MVALKRLLLGRLQDHTWDIEVLSVGQSLVYPGFDDPGIEQATLVPQCHDLLHSVLKADAIGIFVLSDAPLSVQGASGTLRRSTCLR